MTAPTAQCPPPILDLLCLPDIICLPNLLKKNFLWSFSDTQKLKIVSWLLSQVRVVRLILAFLVRSIFFSAGAILVNFGTVRLSLWLTEYQRNPLHENWSIAEEVHHLMAFWLTGLHFSFITKQGCLELRSKSHSRPVKPLDSLMWGTELFTVSS